MNSRKNTPMYRHADKAVAVIGSAIIGILSNSVQTSFFAAPEGYFGFVSSTQFSMLGTTITALGLLLMAYLSYRSSRFVRIIPCLELLLIGFGLAALVLSTIFPEAILGSALFIGLGVALGFGFWMTITAGFGFKSAVFILVAFRCLSALGAYSARLMGLHDVWMAFLATLFVALIPLTLIAQKSTTWKTGLQEIKSPHETQEPLKNAVFKLRDSILFVSIFGFASGALRAFSQIEHFGMFNFAILTCTIAGSLLSLAILKIPRRGFESRTVRISMLLGLATLYLAFPFAPEESWIIFFGLGDILYVAASMYMVFATARFSSEKPMDALFMLGAFKGCVFLAVALGFAANNLLYSFLGRGSTGIFTLSLATVYLIILTILPNMARKAESSAMLIDMTEQQIRNSPTLQRVYGLSVREMDVLVLTIGGSSVAAIAKALYISENTVNDYCSAFATPFHAPLLQRSMADCHTLTI